jgi:hypothetical protein
MAKKKIAKTRGQQASRRSDRVAAAKVGSSCLLRGLIHLS